jgi:NitT/TauT family transport system substrate-binding protein
MIGLSHGRAAVFAAAIVLTGSLGAQAQPALTVVRVVTSLTDDVTSVVYAQQKGLFRKAGLDVQIAAGSSGAATAAAIAGGAYDIGKSSITPMFRAHEKGLPFVLIAPAAVYDSKAPFGVLLVAKDSPIRSGKDLAGKIVGVNSLDDIGRVAIDTWTDKTGGDSHSVSYIEVPLAATPDAIDQHRIAAGEMVWPQLAPALASGRFRAIPEFNAIGTSFLFTVWFTSNTWAKSHPDVVRTFARVVAESATYTNDHPADTAQMMADFTSIPLATLRGIPRVVNGTTLSPALIQPILDASLKDHVIERAFPPQALVASELLPR